MNKKRIIQLCALGAVTAFSLSACGQAPYQGSLRDLEGVQVVDPGYVVLVNNVDKHPNLVIMCANGFGFWTTTRPDFSAAQRLPEMDSFCKTQPDHAMKK